MDALSLLQNDYGYTLTFNIKNSDGTAFNLTGYQAYIKAWKPGRSGFVMVSGITTVTSPSGGVCTYLVQANDFVTTEILYAEIQLTQSGVVQSTETFQIIVRESA